MRLGPTFFGEGDRYGTIAIMAQQSSHLKPVGLYPPIDSGISQLTLLPADATCYGFIGFIPEVQSLVSSISAIVSQDKISLCGSPSLVTGIIRVVTQAMFVEKGLPIEKYEELRQAGDTWYLDICSEGTEIKPMYDGAVTEVWGGLYASGHIEVEGGIQVKPLIDGIMDAFKSAGYEPEFLQNLAETKDMSILARGLRFTISPYGCIYSLHMDAELAINYKRNKDLFNSVCDNLQDVIIESAKKSDAKIINPRDLDFTYTDSAKSFSVLESRAADEISDPVAIVIRDWHRKRKAS